ncbi:GAF and ANTAR domain-containing protein [Actinosynnema sp. NPDC023587]|uniref:GAF and ANTAR domain-containing protein n=1 Tax=Actinosynnema sp. NPDC023587 TaxID=3154695 RepID=UPI003403802A
MSNEDRREQSATGDDLAVRLSDLARRLQEQENAQDTLDSIVHAAVGTIVGAEHAGIMVVQPKPKVVTIASTDEVPVAVDRHQLDTAQGPCLDALFHERVVSVPDLDAEPRWPAFAARARKTDVASMLSFRLFVQGENLGALNLYAGVPHAFDQESAHVGSLFATHAAVALANAQERDHLAEAVQTRDLIGQAKGILMERYKLTADQAFGLIVRASQHTNTRVRDLAERLAHTGQLTPSGDDAAGA